MIDPGGPATEVATLQPVEDRFVPTAAADALSGAGSMAPVRSRFHAVIVRGLLVLAGALPTIVWWAGLFPGTMTADSLDLWRQATQQVIDDTGSPLYASLLWFSGATVGSPWLLTLAQCLLMSCAVLELARACVAAGSPRAVTGIVTAIVLAMPSTGAFTITVWKDVPFTAAIVGLTACSVRWWDARRRRQAPGDHLLRATYALAVTAMLLRQNGILVVFVIAVIVLCCNRNAWRIVATTFVLATATFGVVKTVGYRLADVRPAPGDYSISWMIHDIAGAYRDSDASFEADDRRLMASVMPLSEWTARADCYTANPLFYDSPLNRRRLAAHRESFVSLWMEVVRERPRSVIDNHICAASVAWRPASVDDRISVLYTVSTGIDANRYGLETEPVSDGLRRWLVDVAEFFDDRSRHWYTWRAPTWIYAAYAVALVAAFRRRSFRHFQVLAPVIGLQLSVMVINPAQDARYVFAALLASLLVLPLLGALAVRGRGSGEVLESVGGEREVHEALQLSTTTGDRVEDDSADETDHRDDQH